MSGARVLLAMVKADFLERVRRYSFLLSMGFAVYLGYAVYADQISLKLDTYRGVNNSAWIGSVIGLVATVWLTLVGFYVVKNAIQRDRETGVGQILATTPMSKGFYTLAKATSNFAVLGAMVLVLAIAAVVIQVAQGAAGKIDVAALLSPVLVFGLCGVAVTAAMAVLFESLPWLRGGLGNVLYFFTWIQLLVLSVTGLNSVRKGEAVVGWRKYLGDYTGIASLMGQMQAQVHALDPAYQGGSSFTVGELTATTKTFVWNGIEWSWQLAAGRLVWVAFAAMLVWLAAIFFDRFDPAVARSRFRKARPAGVPTGVHSGASIQSGIGYEAGYEAGNFGESRISVARLTPLTRGASQGRFFALVLAEFRLMARGLGWWWYAVAAGLTIGCLAAPVEVGRGLILAAWLWPVLLWSPMGTREAQFGTGALIFSAQRAFPRQLLATYLAGVTLAVLIGGGLAMRLAIAGDFASLGAWAAGALFIPALALALGVWTESRKPFEALYTAWWYLGPMHHLRGLDFMGSSSSSGTPLGYGIAAGVLVLAACLWRRTRLALA